LSLRRDTIYSYEVFDYSVHCILEHCNEEYTIFTFFDLVSGVKWSIIHLEKLKHSYITELYDTHAVDDKIDIENLEILSDSISVISENYDKKITYRVAVKMID
jgi:hypothetical protein